MQQLLSMPATSNPQPKRVKAELGHKKGFSVNPNQAVAKTTNGLVCAKGKKAHHGQQQAKQQA